MALLNRLSANVRAHFSSLLSFVTSQIEKGKGKTLLMLVLNRALGEGGKPQKGDQMDTQTKETQAKIALSLFDVVKREGYLSGRKKDVVLPPEMMKEVQREDTQNLVIALFPPPPPPHHQKPHHTKQQILQPMIFSNN